MAAIPCSYLGRDVELSPERCRHVLERHPDLLPDHLGKVLETIRAPQQVRRSRRRSDALLLSRCYDALGGRHVVVVVIGGPRPWVVTAYLTRRLIGDVLPWRPS